MGCRCRCASNGVAGVFYYSTMTLFFVAALLGVGFIYTSMSAHFFKWTINDCNIAGRLVKGGTNSSGSIVYYDVDMDADIGWLEFTITYIDPGVANAGCFVDMKQGDTYPIADYQDNSGQFAGFGMVGAWALAVMVALVTLVVMLSAMCRTTSRKGGVGLTSLSKWCALFALGIVVATTVFWWMIEGKFGDREEALAPRLLELVANAAEMCNDGTKSVDPCKTADWEMEAPGWSLILGITAMFAYGIAAFLLYMIAPRVDAILSGSEESEPEPVKHIVGADFMADKQAMAQGDDKIRGKDRRSARTGGRAPSSTVTGTAEAEGPDPMTYALEEGGEEETASTEEERVYQNHHVHPSIVNHSTPNATQQHVDETMSRQSEAMSRASPAVIGTAQRQRAYSRGYSRGNSGQSYTAGGNSFDAPSEGDYSETASSAFYHQGQQHTGSRSYVSEGSKDSFDEFGQR